MPLFAIFQIPTIVGAGVGVGAGVAVLAGAGVYAGGLHGRAFIAANKNKGTHDNQSTHAQNLRFRITLVVAFTVQL